jgi:dienelactone hydrolase
MKTLALLVSLVTVTHATLVEKSVTYQQDGATLEGFHVYDDAVTGKRPAVLVIHQWTGLSESEKRRSRMLAEMGYNVFAADIYGKGIRPQPPEAGDDPSKGAAYDESADRRSWVAMQSFFAELFK